MKRNVVAWAALVLSAAALVSSRGVTRQLPAAAKVPGESQKAAHALSEAFGAVAEFVKPSVVQISVQRKPGAGNPLRNGRRSPFPGGPNLPEGMDPKDLQDMLKKFFEPGKENPHLEKEQFGGGPRGGGGVGSGFVYDDRGHILTNNHVVDEAGKIVVTFYDGIEASATVVGTDPQTDVAVIKVDNTNYRPLPKANAHKVKVGELVMAVGSPYNLDQSVTTGIVSATERNELGINGRDSYESFIQTDAAINPGNSGGPLVDMDGQVIGINSAIVTGGRGNDGVGFAIPIDLAGTVADNLVKNGKVRRSRVGIALEPLVPALARQLGVDKNVRGVLVGDVLKGSPAEKAGLKAGDVITAFNGAPVLSLPAFRLTVASSEAGKEFSLTYFRDGKENKTSIVPAPAEKVVFDIERDKPKAAEEKTKPEPAKVDIKDFGLEIQPLSSDLAEQFGFPKDGKGLLISDVKAGSPAEAAGLQSGLLITKVVKNQRVQALTSVKEFQELTGKGDDVALYVESAKGGGHFVSLSKAKKD